MNPIDSVILFVVVSIAAGVIAFFAFGGHTQHHKVTCWKPTYAANPSVPWAKNPSFTHRHGEGPKGLDICDMGTPITH